VFTAVFLLIKYSIAGSLTPKAVPVILSPKQILSLVGVIILPILSALQLSEAIKLTESFPIPSSVKATTTLLPLLLAYPEVFLQLPF